MTADLRRVRLRDLAWTGLAHLRVFGPFTGIEADALRAALERLHAHSPASPIVCRLTRTQTRYERVSTADFGPYARTLVTNLEPDAGADTLARWLVDQPLGDRAVLLALAGPYLGIKLAHVVCDGRVLNRLLPDLILSAISGAVPQPPVPVPTRLPIVAAATRHFGRDPRRFVTLGRIRRTPGDEAGRDTGSGWRPNVSFVSVRSAGGSARLRRWRDTSAPGVSAAAALCAATWTAFGRCGLPPAGAGYTVLIDVRRFLAPGRGVDGNMSWGPYLAPSDPADPVAVQRALRAELDSGQSIAMLALRSTRIALTGGRAAVPSAPEPPGDRPLPRLTFSHIGRLTAYEALPWNGPPEGYRNVSVPGPDGSRGITVSVSELYGALYLNVSFHASTFDPAVIGRAVGMVADDPVALLSPAGRR